MIIQKAKELAEAIAQSKELKALKDAEAQVRENIEAQNILIDLQEKERMALGAEQSGNDIPEELLQEIQLLYEKMQDNEILRKLIEAQEEFSSVMKTVDAILTKVITGKEDDHCSGNCGKDCASVCCQ